MSRPLPVKALSVFSTKGTRAAQEDFVLASQERGIFVVADGFGGPTPGFAAAKTACESVRGFLEKEAGDLEATLPFVLRSYFSLAGNVLFNALVHANRKVNALNKGKNVHEKGGASVIAAFMDGDLLAIANVGGCTAWLIRGGRCAELVMPRTYARLADPYNVDPAEAHRAPLMAVGTADDLEPEITEYRIRPGDWLLLQTDGLGAEARALLSAHQLKKLKPHEAAQGVTEALKARGYTDNVASSLVIF